LLAELRLEKNRRQQPATKCAEPACPANV
jgi:hypothetical protein